jgi:hypothetical protein
LTAEKSAAIPGRNNRFGSRDSEGAEPVFSLLSSGGDKREIKGVIWQDFPDFFALMVLTFFLLCLY